MKIAIAAHGRFHAFDLGRELLRRGHDVTVFTNYPAWAVEPFGVPRDRVRSFWLHGILSRAAWRVHHRPVRRRLEPWLHAGFGRWLRGGLGHERWDVVHAWSGVAEETLADAGGVGGLRLLMRGSAHIRTQASLLAEEEQRTGAAQDRPSAWMIEREQREYQLANRIVVLSSFARDSFVAQGVAPDKLRLLPLGAALDAFRPSPATVEARRRRILSGAPLRVLYVGAIAFQKGLWDLVEVARGLAGDGFELRLVGPRLPEAAPILAGLESRGITVMPKQPQAALPAVYAWGDVFVFPTIQDGYGMVLAQAAAAGLPIVTTTNSAGPDLVREGESGWVVPIRSPRLLAERLRWCEGHRPELARLAERVARTFQPRDWAAVAADFEAICGA